MTQWSAQFSETPVWTPPPGPAAVPVNAPATTPTQTSDDQDPVTFARTRLGFDPDPIQESMLRADPHRVILNCSRQWGKSTVCAAVAVHRAWTRPRSLVLIAAPTERQSAEFVNKCEDMLRNMGVEPVGDGANRVSIAFANGSRIIGVPGHLSSGTARLRGFAVNLMFVDEAAFLDDAVYHVLRPMLAATKGDLWLLSMPNGRRGFFFETWTYGTNWTRFKAPATDCPRISREFLEDERGEIGATRFQQEYLCDFVESEDAAFSQLVIDEAMDGAVPAIKIPT